MGGFPILSLMLLVPLLGAAACLIGTEKQARWIALGATRANLVWMFLRHASIPIGAGLTCGVAAAMALGRLVAALLYGVTPTDAISYLCAGLTLAAVSFAASYLPIRRALRQDPTRALRA